MADPFAYLVANIRKPVSVRVVGGDRVTGTLLSVDDFGNVLLGDWSSSVTVLLEGGTAPADRKRGRATGGGAGGGGGGDEPSIRFIRGAEIVTISFATPATVAPATTALV